MFNVHYENGEVTSNRRVASDLLDQSFGDSLLDLAFTAIEAQDNEIASESVTGPYWSYYGRSKIKSITFGPTISDRKHSLRYARLNIAPITVTGLIAVNRKADQSPFECA